MLRAYYLRMSGKIVRPSRARDVRIRGAARAKKVAPSTVTRQTVARGNESTEGDDMAQALSGSIGAGIGLSNFSTGREYFPVVRRRRAR